MSTPASLISLAASGPAPAREAVDVLVVDDDVDLRAALAASLTQGGYTFRQAADGRAALVLLGHFQFKLAVTDIYMPEMDGLEFIQRCRSIDPGMRIIACSGGSYYWGVELALDAAHKLGSQQTLEKPFTVAQFQSAVEAMIGPALSQAPAAAPTGS
jgi:DNA-binding NtrC family response regulator